MPYDSSDNWYEEVDMGNGEQVRVTCVEESWSGAGGIRIQIRDADGHLRMGPEFPASVAPEVVRAMMRLLRTLPSEGLE